MGRKSRKLEDIIEDMIEILNDHTRQLQRNNDLIAKNNRLLDSINDYLRKISVNTSS
ncbi:MAG: hypothetical protein MN733_36725 [Nitrososphaera sp.]|nr:hypothetical protein [Nitrososphaera sp.]